MTNFNFWVISNSFTILYDLKYVKKAKLAIEAGGALCLLNFCVPSNILEWALVETLIIQYRH